MTGIKERYEAIRARIHDTTLIAVSKKKPIEAILELYELGQRDFGENYVQELTEKAELAQEKGLQDIRWHFIGHLQTNKVKALLPWVFCIHSVDSEKLAKEISRRATEQGKKVPVFLEVNVDAEPTKSGVIAEDVPRLANEIAALPGLELQGLMCIPEAGKDSRPAFEKLRGLELYCRPATKGFLSMGMSEDFETAIREGATHIRVGTALFGPR